MQEIDLLVPLVIPNQDSKLRLELTVLVLLLVLLLVIPNQPSM